MHLLFGSLLSPALDLVDRMGVSLVRGEEGEGMTVRGSSGLMWESKHILAVRLTIAMQMVNV